MRRSTLVTAGLLGFSLLVPGTTAQAATCVSADLPLPAGFTNGSVSGSDGTSGRLVGGVWTDTDSRRHGVVWENGTPRLLGQAPFGDSTFLGDVNSSGVAIGSASDLDFSVPLRYQDGAFTALPSPAGATEVGADAVNNAGTIVGGGRNGGPRQVFVWRGGNNPEVLEVPGQAAIQDIDESGRIVTSTTTGPRSFAWSVAGVRAELAPFQAGWWVSARDIRAGRIVGLSGDGNGASAAVQWEVDGRIVRTFPGAVDALDINAEGTVLGVYEVGRQPALWVDGQLATVLPTPTNAVSVSAGEITDDGVVTGNYRTGDNHLIPTRWTCG